MSSVNSISVDKLTRLIGVPRGPRLIDIRTDEDFALDPRLIPGSLRQDWRKVADGAPMQPDRPVILVCQRGAKLSHGAAALLRSAGAKAEVLEGGFEAWVKSGASTIPAEKLPPRDGHGRTLWVTRERPKVDRIACPWLIRRFVDPTAVFLFVAPPEVKAVAERFGAAPFDIEDVFWSHRGETCTFDTMVLELGLTLEPLKRLATIVRAADTARLDLAPQAAGLLAASLGLSRLYANDLDQMEAGFLLYDAFYRWCRDATDETHNWPTNKPASR